MQVRILVFLSLSVLTSALYAQPGPGPQVDTSWIKTKYLDVAYAQKSGTQKLDLYLPKEGSGPFPVIIEIHGGGFMMGSKTSMAGAPLQALKRGYAVASVNYRLSGEARFPAAVQDVKAAIRFLRASAQKYNLNPQKFASWGGSAGGNLSALVGTSAGVAALSDPSLGNPGISEAVQASVDWYGPIYFSTMDQEFQALGQTPAMGKTNTPNSPESKYLGKTIGTKEAEDLVKQASPLTYLDPQDPPFFVQHGTADRNIPLTQSKNFAQKLAEVLGKDRVIFESLEGAGHGGAPFETPENVKKILDFLDKVLK